MDQKLIVPINNDIPAAEAGFLEPVSTVVQGIHKVGVKPMQDVVVIGGGTMGLVNAQVAKAFGARVIVSDISQKKIKRAQEMGVDVVDAKNNDPVEAVKDLTNGKGADIVIAAVGSSIAYKQGYDMLSQYRGKLLIFPAGYPKPELHVDPNELHYRKLRDHRYLRRDLKDWYEAATLISKRLIDCSYSLEGKIHSCARHPAGIRSSCHAGCIPCHGGSAERVILQNKKETGKIPVSFFLTKSLRICKNFIKHAGRGFAFIK